MNELQYVNKLHQEPLLTAYINQLNALEYI